MPDGSSVYGGGVVGSAITGGVSNLTETGGGFYNLGNAYSHATISVAVVEQSATNAADMGVYATSSLTDQLTTGNSPFGTAGTDIASLSDAQKKAIRFDPDLLNETSTDRIYHLVARLTNADLDKLNMDNLAAMDLHNDTIGGRTFNNSGAEEGLTNAKLIRRLTERGYRDSDGNIVSVADDADALNMVTFYVQADSGTLSLGGTDGTSALQINGPAADAFEAGSALGSVRGTDNWPLEEPNPGTGQEGSGADKDNIAEIDIKVDSIAVTAMTKKLKAKWSPELGQDLNAYHNLDAEVELTQILSEQIALEIDREILNDLIQGATAGTQYWSRSPGLFVNRVTGAEIGQSSAAPDFTGTVSEWYETLIETINDVSAQIHRKTLRGGANFIVTSPEVANILEFTAGFRANVTHDADRGSVGAVNVGSLSRKFDVHVDPYFPRNVVLVGRKGGSFLESGYVYAPYVPLQVTPTIFGTEDFVPRKGVMTRYAKQMVRPDMYGLVICRGLLGEAGATS